MAKGSPFNAPDDVEHDARANASVAVVKGLSTLVGTWTACDTDSGGLVQVVIAAVDSGVIVHAIGDCTPTPCDWGRVVGHTYATDIASTAAVAFNAEHKSGFSETTITGVLDHGTLIVETFTRFNDGSNRSNYYSKEYLYKRPD
jgi:hypothetical protein